MMDPIRSGPLGDGTADLFRQGGPPALDPYRTYFRAVITGRADVGGVWHYAWKEQAHDTATGATADANPRREGTTTVSPALEINNAGVEAGTVVFMRQKGIVRGQMFYEFDRGRPCIEGVGTFPAHTFEADLLASPGTPAVVAGVSIPHAGVWQVSFKVHFKLEASAPLADASGAAPVAAAWLRSTQNMNPARFGPNLNNSLVQASCPVAGLELAESRSATVWHYTTGPDYLTLVAQVLNSPASGAWVTATAGSDAFTYSRYNANRPFSLALDAVLLCAADDSPDLCASIPGWGGEGWYCVDDCASIPGYDGEGYYCISDSTGTGTGTGTGSETGTGTGTGTSEGTGTGTGSGT